ncbi:glycerol kinase [Lichtheimia ornata]|uniref:Probable glycerol kinase n=1 Tax=Lichtheimia ornata TaxID=688661 RepID=A0AAD7V504_9FUNG|nr:glycerol kinase [Lichtheimia ornata]KAJ8659439.1 glycerol kinase [Lichtheimia ornata]
MQASTEDTTTYIGAIDAGTTSARFLIFTDKGKLVASHQLEFEQIYPRPGWIEHDPQVLVDVVNECATVAIRKFGMMGYDSAKIRAIGISNQRETTLVWDRETGEPLYNAIVWGDGRTNNTVRRLKTKDKEGRVSKLCGLPIHNYFSAVKMYWLMHHKKDIKKAINDKRAVFGTVDSWLIWYSIVKNLTGGKAFVTDVTNACRTMLMNLETRKWDPELLSFFDIPEDALPKIVSSAEHYGTVNDGPLEGLPIMGCLGDQQAAFVGQRCFQPGEAKNTYGTGAFLLLNVGDKPVSSNNGLLSTVGYQLGKDAPVTYALEGSISVAGAAVNWLRNNLGMIKEPKDVSELASQVHDTGGVMFVTAFSGLFAPYWRDDARATLVGLTQYTNKCHIARATLEAVCYSTRAILDAMTEDGNVPLKLLKADGGMSNSDICMQIQADILGIPVERPAMRETTGFGAALAAGLAIGVWKDIDTIHDYQDEKADVFQPNWDDSEREHSLAVWNAAVQRSMGWTDVYHSEE